MCNSNTSINHESIAKEIASAIADMSVCVVDHLSDTFDGERDHVIEFVDGTPVPFCPVTRRQCMGRLCAAARREDCKKLATINTGHVAEWKCGQYGTVVDFDEPNQPTPEELAEVRIGNIAHIAEVLGNHDVDVARVYYDLMGIYDAHQELRGRKLFELMAGIRHGDYDRADSERKRPEADCGNPQPILPVTCPADAQPRTLDYLLDEDADEDMRMAKAQLWALARRVDYDLTSVVELLEQAMTNAGEVKMGTLASYLLSEIEAARSMVLGLRADAVRTDSDCRAE